jgi:hypothetical protein
MGMPGKIRESTGRFLLQNHEESLYREGGKAQRKI